jgi:hypothetical protein
MIQYFKDKYGEDSSVFAVRVKGNPPLSDDDKLIPFEWAHQCIGAEIFVEPDDPLYLGVDVARYGDDSSIIMPRQGYKILPWYEHNNLNTISLGGEIQLVGSDLEAEGVAIDEIGVGAGVTDWLYKHNAFPTFGINVATVSSDKKKYDRLRDELWCKVRDNCMKGKYSFPDGEMGDLLCDELASIGYDFNALGGIKVESKKSMKSKGIKSPNTADALCLTEYFFDVRTAVFTQKKRKAKKKLPRNSSSYNPYNWMVV